jgi:fructosamine-3-kinase
MMPMGELFGRRVAEVLGVEVVELRRVSGGDVAEAYRVGLADGRTVFAKTHADPPPDFFSTEATGLSWLAEATAAAARTSSDPIGLAVARVIASDDDLLVLAWIDEGRPVELTETDFGRALAQLHRVGAPVFGRTDRRTTGSRALPNEPMATWAEFYARNRLEPLARLARDGGALGVASIQRLVEVAGRLGEIGASTEPPALLHGDLWAGNRLLDRRGLSWLIDPAVHGGHREFDLAMMALFGGFGDECWRGYDDEFPLAAGWRDRVPVHQLAPLVVHAINFGGGYASAVDRALDACDPLL